jgi:hypothetical protein
MKTIQKITFTEMENICKNYLKDSWDNNELYKFLIGPKLTKTMIYFGTERIQKVHDQAILFDAITNNKQNLFILITYSAGCDLFNLEFFYDEGQHIITLNQVYLTDILNSINDFLFPLF